MTRRALFWAILGVAVVLLLEVTSWLSYWVIQKERFSHGKLGQSLRLVAANPRVAHPTADTRDALGEAFFGSWQLRLHPYVGFTHDPDLGALAGTPINDLGWPGESPLSPRQPDEVRVAVFGGSVSLGLWLYGGQTLVTELGKAPALAGKKVRLYSVAVGGFKQPQQLVALTYLAALGTYFDIVINLDGLNEIALAPVENRPYDPSSYPRGWNHYAQRALSPARLALVGRVAAYQEARRSLAATLSRSVARYSTTVGLFWTLVDRALDRRLTAAQLELSRSDPSTSPRVPRTEYRSDDEMYRVLVSLWSRSSIQMAQLVACSGGLYLHFLQPNQYLAGSKPLTEHERARAYLPDHPYRMHVVKGYPLLREAGADLARRGVNFFDLTQLFAGSGEEIYSDTCCHFTLQGYERIGREAARQILTVMTDIRTGARGGAPAAWPECSGPGLRLATGPAAGPGEPR